MGFWALGALFFILHTAPLASAGDLQDLNRCFNGIQYLSVGPGDDIGKWERWTDQSPGSPHLRTLLAVPGTQGGAGTAEGMWFYTDENVYFTPQPRSRDTDLMGYHFNLKLPDREPLHCNVSDTAASWADVHAKNYRRGTRCLLFDDPAEHEIYHSAKPKPLPASVANRFQVLKTAIALRLNSLAAQYQKEVSTYADRLDAYRRCEGEGGIGGLMRSLGGMTPARPTPPDRSPYLRALSSCPFPEDDFLRSNADGARNLINTYPVPSNDPSVPRSCGGS